MLGDPLIGAVCVCVSMSMRVSETVVVWASL